MTPPAAPGGEYEVVVDRITSEGAGVGRLPDGRAVFVHRTAPGDRVRLTLTRTAGRWARGRVLELLDPGPDRRAAPCPHYDRCGGCTLEHLTYPAQLEAKSRIVTDALTRIGKRSDLPAAELHPSPSETRYRNRVSFALLRRGGGRVVAGFHELERPDRVFDVDGRCLLPEEPISRSWDALRASWGPAASRLPSGRELRLTLRATAAGEVLLLVEGGRGEGDPAGLVAGVPELVAVWKSEGVAGDRPRLLAGSPHLIERWDDEPVELHPRSFLQVNRTAAALLQAAVLGEMGEVRGARVVDAYCGLAVYGRRAAARGSTSVGIEADPEAAEAARALAGRGCRILVGRVEDRLGEALPADLVILNPPRAGVAAGVMEQLGTSRPRRILYVSCDPATLARDLGRLGRGYGITRLQIFDLFPQTSHVETVLTLDPVSET